MVIILFFVAQAIIPDFQVNSEDYPGNAPQLYPAIATYDSGGVVIWYDLRPPAFGTKVFGSLLNADGDTIGSNWRLNEDTTHGCMNMPAVDSDSTGNFTITYIQQGNVIARRFNKYGVPLGPSFIVNTSSNCSYPAIRMTNEGRFVVTWFKNDEYRIYGQIYNREGNPIGTNFLVSDSTLNYGTIPDVAVKNNGEFIIAWTYNSDIWAQRFDSLGDRIGENFKLINDTTNISENYPKLKFDYQNRLFVSWNAFVQGQSDVNCQIFDSTLTPITSIIKLDDVALDSSQRQSIAIRDSIWYVVFQNGISTIHLQRVKNNGELIGNNIRISEQIGRSNTLPKIDATMNYFIITWSWRIVGIMCHIMCQKVSFDGNLIGTNYAISDDKGGEPQFLPSVAADSSGNFFIVWEDSRRYPEYYFVPNQYGRRYDASGNPLCSEFKNNTYANASYSAIGINSNIYLTAWACTEIDSNHQIYAQRFDYNGNSIGSNLQVSMSQGNYNLSFPKITTLSNGHFVIIWNENDGAKERTYGRLLDNNGLPYGNQFNPYVDSFAFNYGWTAVDEENNRFIVPLICSIDTIACAIQEFDYEGNPISTPIILNDEPAPYYNFVNGAKGIDRYLFIWGEEKIIGQFLNNNLQKIGNNFIISDDTISPKNFYAVVSHNDGKFFVVWDEARNNNYDLYGQFFDSLGNRIDNNFRVDNDTTNSDQIYVSCFSVNDRIYIVWSDTRMPANWYDIYCKVIEWTGSQNIGEIKVKDKFAILSISPNPFKSATSIKFQIPIRHDAWRTKSQINPNSQIVPSPFSFPHWGEGWGEGKSQISLMIYDVTGRLIKSFLLPTAHFLLLTSVEWNGTDDSGRRLPAGVYFVRLNCPEGILIQKVVKLK